MDSGNHAGKRAKNGTGKALGNLGHSVTNDELEELFANYGDVEKVNIIEGKGFGFVEMSSRSEAEQAKQALHASEFKNRTLRVDEARPPKSRRTGDYRRY